MAKLAVAKWLGPPRSYTSGRKSGQPNVIVIHTTEGSEGTQSAEDGAAYDKRRADGTSTHFFVDSNSIVQCVDTMDEAHAARSHGNDIGIQIEVCGRSSQSDAQWNDAASQATLRNLVTLCKAILKVHKFTIRHLTVSEVRSTHPEFGNSGRTGFCSHYDITRAFPEDRGDHTDPGSNFPWTNLLFAIKESDEMTPDEVKSAVLDALKEPIEWNSTGVANYAKLKGWGSKVSMRALLEYVWSTNEHMANEYLSDIKVTIMQVLNRVSDDPSIDVTMTDEDANNIAGMVVQRLSVPTAQETAQATVAEMKKEGN